MSLIEQLNHMDDFTDAEKAIIQFILANPGNITADTTAAQIAENAYSSASTVVRLCKKLGYSSFADFKMKFITHYQQHEDAVLYIDATIPFKSSDSQKQVLKQLNELSIITLNQTFSLIDFDSYDRIINILTSAKCIDIYGAGPNVKLLYDFAIKMGSIHRQVRISSDHHQQLVCAASKFTDHCAIIISYSGEKALTLQYASLLKKNNIPTISITNNNHNSLTAMTNEHLYLASSENIAYKNTKIGSFSSGISILTLMNYLYAGVFLHDYDKNFEILVNDRIIFNLD